MTEVGSFIESTFFYLAFGDIYEDN